MIRMNCLTSLGLLLVFCLFIPSVSSQKFYNSPEFQKIDKEFKKLDKSNDESISAFIQEWESKALKSGDSVAMAYVWMTGTKLYSIVNKFPEALSYGNKASKIITSQSLSDKLIYNKLYLVQVHTETGNYEKAIELSLQSTDEFDKYKPYDNRLNYHALASCYLSVHNYERMDYYLQKWHDLVQDDSVGMHLGFGLYIMHEFYDKAEMYEKASFFQNEFYGYFANKSDEISKIPEHAFITISGSTPDETIQKLLKYLPYHEINGRNALVTKTNQQLGKLFLEKGDLKKATSHLNEAINNTKGVSLENQIDALAAHSKVEALNGNFEAAFSSSSKSIILRDSSINNQVLAQANELEAKYENEKKELVIELKEAQIQAQNRWLLFSAIAGIVIIGSAFFIFYLYRKLKSNNKILSLTLKDKDTLLQEIHHRVKNNLQVISSLLSLQSRYVKDKTAISALSEGQNRVESMALIHQNLYRADNISGVDMKSYIHLLADSIFNSYNIQGDMVKIEYEIDDITLDVSTVIPIGLVLNEIISNSLKYAFVGMNHGKLKVAFTEKSDALLLSVSDNGIGLKPESAESGFGTKLINSFTRKLNGELKISSEKGTTVEILIRNYKRA